jgi:putative transmembrane protein PGPGW
MQLIPRETLITLGIISVVFFVATLIIIPILIIRLPSDYFDENQPRIWLRGRHPMVRVTIYVIKTAIGLVFVVAGTAMLVLPGQGILTIIIGLSLVDFPGKRKVERKLIGRPTVLHAINSIRGKFGRPPLVVKAAGNLNWTRRP